MSGAIILRPPTPSRPEQGKIYPFYPSQLNVLTDRVRHVLLGNGRPLYYRLCFCGVAGTNEWIACTQNESFRVRHDACAFFYHLWLPISQDK